MSHRRIPPPRVRPSETWWPGQADVYRPEEHSGRYNAASNEDYRRHGHGREDEDQRWRGQPLPRAWYDEYGRGDDYGYHGRGPHASGQNQQPDPSAGRWTSAREAPASSQWGYPNDHASSSSASRPADMWAANQSRHYSSSPSRLYTERSSHSRPRTPPDTRPRSRSRDAAPYFPEPVLRQPLWREPNRQGVPVPPNEVFQTNGHWAVDQNNKNHGDWSGESSRASTRGTSPYPHRPFAVTMPDPEYLRISSEKPGSADLPPEGFFPKLIILDLNGALVYRTSRSGEKRKAYPRPYLSCFLEYLFLSETPQSEAPAQSPDPAQPKKRSKTDQTLIQLRPYEVFVWSSAQPHNVRSMVENTFGLKWPEGIWETEKKRTRDERLARGEGRILKVWARDTLGLSAAEYGKKVQTIKDLRKVIDFFKTSRAVEHAYLPKFDERNTVLVDDSPMKAVCQPWNQLVIPEYDKKEFQASRDVAMRLARKPDASTEGLDEILLGVIGILEEMRLVENVPAWIRGGGLLPLVQRDSMVHTARTPGLEDLPSHDTFQHWYDRPEQLAYWIDKGRKALERRGIEIAIGLDPQAAMSPPPPPPPTRDTTAGQQPSIEQALNGERNPQKKGGRTSSKEAPPPFPSPSEEEEKEGQSPRPRRPA